MNKALFLLFFLWFKAICAQTLFEFKPTPMMPRFEEKQAHSIENNVAKSFLTLKLKHADGQVISDLLKQQQALFDGAWFWEPVSRSFFFYGDKTAFQHFSGVVQKIDLPIRQIQISARIILASRDFTERLGARIGAKVDTAKLSAHAKSQLNHHAFAQSAIGQVAFLVQELVHIRHLDVAIAALEQEGLGEIISKPSLITSDYKQAVIESGEEIPFQTSSRYDGKLTLLTSFKKAVLALKVLPTIQSDGRIKLVLTVTQNTRGSATSAGLAINTQKIETEIIVQDGNTVVLGGIKSNALHQNIEKIPWLSRIPIIGFLFKTINNIDKRRELLIFVTPKIIT